MKHLLFIIMILATFALLSGCGSSSDPASGTATAAPLKLVKPTIE